MISPFPFDRALYYSSFMCLYLFSLFLLLFIPPSYHNQQEINCSFIIMKICFIFFHYSDFSSIFHFFHLLFLFYFRELSETIIMFGRTVTKAAKLKAKLRPEPNQTWTILRGDLVFFQISILSFFFWALQLSIMISIGSSHPGR